MKHVEAWIDTFRYEREPGVEKWRYIADRPVGDCEDFARTVAQLYYGGTTEELVRQMQKGNVKFILCWSPSNGWIPRHTIVWIRGKGYVDSTKRIFRPDPKPHKKAFRWPNWLVRRLFK